MSFARKVERQREVNRVVELKRKLRKASARRANLQFSAKRTADERAQEALRASAQNT